MIYIDNAATTRVDADVAREILKTMMEEYGNPSSIYKIGRDSKQIIADSANAVLQHLGADTEDDEIIFTASGSEANNLALTGFSKYCDKNNISAAVYCTPIEHKSIINQPCAIKTVPIMRSGIVDINQLEKMLRAVVYTHEMMLFSIQLANNEIGSMNSIALISDMIHKYHGCYLHVDATQAFGAYTKDILKTAKIDMMTASFHKIHCPKGIGMLYVSKPFVQMLEPVIYGGGQMLHLRAGTENVPYIAGVKVAMENLDKYYSKEILNKTTEMRDYITDKIQDDVDNCIVNGSQFCRLYNNISISFKDIDSESLVALLDTDGICASAGSACNSEEIEPSYVLKAIDVPADYIYGTLRLTIDETITQDDADYVVKCIKMRVSQLRNMMEGHGYDE